MKIVCYVIMIMLFSVPFLSAESLKNKDPEVFASGKRKRDFTGVYPQKVKTIAIITPASYPAPSNFKTGIKRLREAGYKVKIYPNVLKRPEGVEKNYYAAIPIELRVSDFEAAWCDMENDMIICARGGRGTEELVAKINWDKLPRRPELYVQGYSDVTMLLSTLSAKGYGRPVAGINITSHPGVSPEIIPAIRKMYHNEEVSFKIKPLRAGECSGKVVAGLLSRFVRVAETGCPLETRGKIIVIESVYSNSTVIEKHLNTLLEKGFFKDASALVFGHFVKATDQKKVPEVLRKFAAKLNIPVYYGLPFGHTAKNASFDFKRQAFIKNNTLTFPVEQQD